MIHSAISSLSYNHLANQQQFELQPTEMAKINYLLKGRSCGQVVYFVDPALVYSFIP